MFFLSLHQNAGRVFYSPLNDYFDQRLGCAAPKRWSKYTTREAQRLGINGLRFTVFSTSILAEIVIGKLQVKVLTLVNLAHGL